MDGENDNIMVNICFIKTVLDAENITLKWPRPEGRIG